MMIPTKIISISLLTLTIAACGGGSPSKSPTTDTSTPTTGTPTTGTPTTGTPSSGTTGGDKPAAITTIGLGSGTGTDFIAEKLTLSQNYSLLGSGITVGASVVNTGKDRGLVVQSYQYKFSSTCADKTPAEASFVTPTVLSTIGTAETIYKNINCKEPDTITVKLFSADGVTELKTASSIVPVSIPQIGYLDGPEYVDGLISGNTALISEKSTKLTANLVDVQSLNSVITSADYTAKWSSTCSEASFSIAKQSLSTPQIITRYNANSCKTSDMVTLSVYAKDNLETPIDSTSVKVTIGVATGTSSIELGAGEGSTFVSGKLAVERDYSLLGSSINVGVSVVDNNNDRSRVTQSYRYKFSSACAEKTPAEASFVTPLMASAVGKVETVYKNINCKEPDTITVKLFSADGATELKTASSIVPVSVPQIGYLNGPEYVDGLISGNTALIGESTTKLTANLVDVQSLNSVITSADYIAKWSSTCSEASFSIAKQSLSTPQIITRYNANSCKASDTVTLSVYAKDNLEAPIDSSSVKITIGVATGTSSIALGAGDGPTFVSGKLALNRNYVLLGSSLNVGATVVDNDKDRSLVTTQSYQYKFSSICAEKIPAEAAFVTPIVTSSIGIAGTTYQNINCKQPDAITVKLFSADGATELKTASSVIPISVPQIGYLHGPDYVDNFISGNKALTSEKTTKLTANLVDILSLNKVIESADYTAKWSSTCSAASFSVSTQSLITPGIITRYNANSCTTSDTVTLSVYSNNNLTTPVDSVSAVITIAASSSTSEVPKLGNGFGGNFNAGQLALNVDYVLAGGSAVISVNGVNSANANVLLTKNYLYKFESSCATGSTRFSSDVLVNGTGSVSNTYFNQTCTGGDTVTVSLYSASANVNTDPALATATASFQTALPKLGFGTGADFVEDSISGNTNLVDGTSTKLSATVIDPLDVNKQLRTSGYSVSWKDDCASSISKFSIGVQSLKSDIVTRYDADAASCKTPIITIELSNQFGEVLAAVKTDITLAESLVPATPALGTGVALTFTKGAMKLSESPISARQTVGVFVNIVDVNKNKNSLLDTAEYAVLFSSACVADDRASFDTTEKRTTSGKAEVYYTAKGCEGEDRINATLHPVKDGVVNKTTSLAVATTVLTINSPAINSVEFKELSTDQIAMKGISYSELPEVAEVSFLVKDEYNQPTSGKKVFFKLSNPSVDATLSGIVNSNGKVEATTNAQGIATAFVNSGTTHGLLSVLAEITRKDYGINGDRAAELADTDRIQTRSFRISITTGVPVQPSFTLSANTRNVQGWDRVGQAAQITASLNDRFQNHVPNGTRINFVADGGRIESSCATVKGTCNVVWTSSNPRPGFNKDNGPNLRQKSNEKNADGSKQLHPTNDKSSSFYFNKDNVGNLLCGDGTLVGDASAACDSYRLVDEDPNWKGGRGGVVSILAYTQGEVDFSDGKGTNGGEGNNRFDPGEDFKALAEAFLDANENGVYDIPDENNPFEQLIEFDNNGAYTPAPNYYQGGTCSDAGRANGGCATPVHIRQTLNLNMSSDLVHIRPVSVTGLTTGKLTPGQCINIETEKKVTFVFGISDYNGNSPVSKSGLNLSGGGFKVVESSALVTPDTFGKEVDFKVTLEPASGGEIVQDGELRLVLAHPDGVSGNAGSYTFEKLTSDPRIKISTTDFLMDAKEGSQILKFQFLDACGNPPSASDIIIFDTKGISILTFDKAAEITTDAVTNKKTYEEGTPPVAKDSVTTARKGYFQIFGGELNSKGELYIEISNEITASDAATAEALRITKNSEKATAQTAYDATTGPAKTAATAATSAATAATSAATAATSAAAQATAAANELVAKQAALDALSAGDPGIPAATTARDNAQTAKTNADIAKTNADTAKTNADSAKANADATKASADAVVLAAKVELDTATNAAAAASKAASAAQTGAALTKGEIEITTVNRAAEDRQEKKTFEVRL